MSKKKNWSFYGCHPGRPQSVKGVRDVKIDQPLNHLRKNVDRGLKAEKLTQ